MLEAYHLESPSFDLGGQGTGMHISKVHLTQEQQLMPADSEAGEPKRQESRYLPDNEATASPSKKEPIYQPIHFDMKEAIRKVTIDKHPKLVAIDSKEILTSSTEEPTELRYRLVRRQTSIQNNNRKNKVRQSGQF